jgi:hypothetical protein
MLRRGRCTSVTNIDAVLACVFARDLDAAIPLYK